MGGSARNGDDGSAAVASTAQTSTNPADERRRIEFMNGRSKEVADSLNRRAGWRQLRIEGFRPVPEKQTSRAHEGTRLVLEPESATGCLRGGGVIR